MHSPTERPENTVRPSDRRSAQGARKTVATTYRTARPSSGAPLALPITFDATAQVWALFLSRLREWEAGCAPSRHPPIPPPLPLQELLR